MRKLLLIDGHNLLWKSYSVPFAFYSKKGTPLHVITTFLSLLKRAINGLQDFSNQDVLIVVFDTEEQTNNHLLSPIYKANRKKDFSNEVDSPFSHLPLIQAVLSQLNIPQLMQKNYEADDLIATISRTFNQSPSHKSYILSTDTDFYQLVDNQTYIIKLSAKEKIQFIDQNYIETTLGISPNEYCFYKSLIGDKTDNIVGIKGVGPITARKIVKKEIEFALDQYGETLELNKKLITLSKNIVEVELSKFYFTSNFLTLSNNQIFEMCNF